MNAEHPPTEEERAKLREGLEAFRDELPVAILFHPQRPEELLITWRGQPVGGIRQLELVAFGRGIFLELEAAFVPEPGSDLAVQRDELRAAGIAVQDGAELLNFDVDR